jgi:primosomal protein N' (replication factor Y)
VGVFHYHLPPELEGLAAPGCLVEVPFGKQRVQGILLRQVASPSVPETRPVGALIDPQPAVTTVQMALAAHLAEVTLAPLAACLDLMLPPGLSQQVDTLYTLAAPAVPVEPGSQAAEGGNGALSPLQERLLALLEKRGPLRGRQIEAALPKLDWRKAAGPLRRRGLLTSRPVLPPPTVRPKFVRTAQLAAPPEQAMAAMPNLGRSGSASLERRQAILRCLLREPGQVEVPWLYAESGGNLADLEKLAELGLIVLGESEIWRDPLENLDLEIAHPLESSPGAPLPPLTPDQAAAWEKLRSAVAAAFAAKEPGPPFLLHGVTGSGKTELYLRAVAETLRQGRGAIVLVPEIALTPQTVRRFLARFPGQVGLVHSRLSAGERYDTWRRARLGQLPVIVGPRSALFTPLPDLGLVVVDECHEDSYYQSDLGPSYHAREAAAACARLAGAVCLLGSATPDLTSTYRAAQGEYRYLRLPKRIIAHRERVGEVDPAGAAEGLPPVRVVDMRLELQAGNRSLFSRQLQESLQRVLERGQQAILFLNRRGAATYIFCRDCGQALKCPRCGLPLTYHLENSQLVRLKGAETQAELPNFSTGQRANLLTCHYCGYRRGLPPHCPSCGSGRIRHYGAGTQRVEEELQAFFPSARTLRWDAETARQKGAHEVILAHFANRRADVLIGTQMLAKGLDLPYVTLVGVVLADVGLHFPDYRAGERVFGTLTQVAGRAGRSPLGGEAILQTFDPEHYVIQAAAGHDYRGFYEKELEYRRRLRYPPFSQLVRLEYRHRDQDQAEAAAQAMAEQLRLWLEAEDRRATDLIGPAPPFFDRLGGLYRWQIVLRGPNPASLLRGRPLGDWRVEVDPISLL